ncbi:hypothetical protein [Helicobacter felis]|uniref:hypothetical protein n=1 Tax=Helicobacter felis TaxID=214 RepID=UPI000CF14B01|nr:hypothetical protein [Helicobacter felis]
MQEINDKMQRAGLLELFEEATEIQEDFKHILELSNKNKNTYSKACGKGSKDSTNSKPSNKPNSRKLMVKKS